MPAELELEEEAAQEEEERLAQERRERNGRAIAEVVGRTPARKPAHSELIRSTAKDRN